VAVSDEAVAHWARICDGDARRALNALEVAVLSQHGRGGGPVVIDLACAEESIQAKAPVFDRTGDEHYDLASALIKSMRGSDPDAAVYWLARMLEAGEDPRFIARRIAILASEDIGNADPQAIAVAAAAWELCDRVGLPECQFALAQAAIYMAAAEKSNACATAIASARRDVREQRTIPVPRHLRSTGYPGAIELGHGENYVYPHDAADGYVPQEYLGVDRVYYEPTGRGREAEIRRRLEDLAARGGADPRRPAPPESRAAAGPP
jgi:putative ATPase